MPHSPPRRDARLRLALQLERLYATRAVPLHPVLSTVDHVLLRLRRLQQLQQQRQVCQTRHWSVAGRTVTGRLAGELRELSYLLSSVDRSTPIVPASVTAGGIYRDLLALDEEFGGIEIASDLSSIRVVTDPITLEEVGLGRFAIRLDLGRLSRGGFDTAAVTAEALDPHPAACNPEVVHPHVQGGCICFGEGSPLLRAALAEGRLYDALLVTRQVLRTYNEASPYLRLDQWSGRYCEECEDLTAEDELYGCQACGTSLCSSCERTCGDCESTHCRRCLHEDGDDLVCSDCLAQRERQRDEDDEELEDEPIHPLPEPAHG